MPKNLGTVNIGNINNFIVNHNLNMGIFKSIDVGDCFTIHLMGADHIVRIAGLDFYFDKFNFPKHHIVCVTDMPVAYAPMHAPDQDNKSYLSSYVWNNIIPQINIELSNIFGIHLLKMMDAYGSVSCDNIVPRVGDMFIGGTDGLDWRETKSTILSEIEVTGNSILSSSKYDIGISKQQLPLFIKYPNLKYMGVNYWLRDMCSCNHYVEINNPNLISYKQIDRVSGVRPRWIVG